MGTIPAGSRHASRRRVESGRRVAVSLALLLTLQFLLLLPGLEQGIGIDFGGALTIAQEWTAGTPLYRIGVAGGRPPLIYAYMALGVLLFGPGTTAPMALRLGLWASVMATTIALYLLSRRYMGHGWSLLACLIFVLNPLLLSHGADVHTSTLLVSLQAVALLLFSRGIHPLHRASLLGSGVFAGLSAMTFQPGAGLLAFLLLVLALGPHRLGLEWACASRRPAAWLLVSGAGIGWLPVVLVEALRGRLGNFAYCVVSYPYLLSSRAIAVSGSSRIHVMWRGMVHLFMGPDSSPAGKCAAVVVVALLCASFAATLIGRRRRHAFLQAWLILGGGASLLLVREPWSSHYLLSLLPVIALLAAAGASWILDLLSSLHRVRRRFPVRLPFWAGRAWAVGLVAALVLPLVAGELAPGFEATLEREAALASITSAIQPESRTTACVDWLGYHYLWGRPPAGSLDPVLSIGGRATPVPLFILSQTFQSDLLGAEEVAGWVRAMEAGKTSLIMVEVKNWVRIKNTPGLAPLEAYVARGFPGAVAMDLPANDMLVFLRGKDIPFSIFPFRADWDPWRG